MQTELITKEQAREQFDKITKQYNLVHTFSFDEVYDMMMERRIAKQKQVEFRKGLVKFEEKLKELPGAFVGDHYPLTHTFADGMYIRQITVPGNVITVTKIHAQTHPFFLLKGTISILTEKGVEKITAPYSGITKAGTKRIIWHHDEVVLTTVHRTNEVDLAKIEEEVIAKDFDDLQERVDHQRIEEFVKLMQEK